MKALCVGICGYGQQYVRTLFELEEELDVNITGAVDPAPERSSLLPELEDRGVPICGSMEEFYAEHDADAAFIASPIQFHVPQSLRALSHGTHVLCEKPLCATIQEARQAVRAHADSGLCFGVGYQWSFCRAVQDLKRDIRDGVLGAPKRLSCLVLWPRTESYYGRNSWAGALKDAQGQWVLDSPVNNATAHFLHNMFYLLGDERRTSAVPVEVTGELYRANDIQNYDTAALRARTEGGVEVRFYSSHAPREQAGPVSRYEFENATVTSKSMNSPFVAQFADGTEKSYGAPDHSAEPKVRQFLDAVRGGDPVACRPEAASAQTLCMNGLQESAQIVPFPDDIVRVEENDDDRRRYVKGLGDVLTRCFEQSALPAELDVPWSRAGRTVDLAGYARFPRA
jgi:predicted dehydrogenase